MRLGVAAALAVATIACSGSPASAPGPAGPAPAGRGAEHLVFDPRGGSTWLFGGYRNGAIFDDTWTFDGARWIERAPPPPVPSKRIVHALAFDRGRGVLVSFGGRNDTAEAPMNDTWTWDGRAWTLVPTAGAPAGRFDMGLGYDVA